MTKEETLENTPTVDTTTKRTDKRAETHTCDYIDRQAAIKALRKGKPKETEYRGSCADSCGIGKLLQYESDISAVIALPSARKKGKWKYEKMKHILNGEVRTVRICSECNGGWFRYDLSDGVEDVEPNYCPNCGADMRGGSEDE